MSLLCAVGATWEERENKDTYLFCLLPLALVMNFISQLNVSPFLFDFYAFCCHLSLFQLLSRYLSLPVSFKSLKCYKIERYKHTYGTKLVKKEELRMGFFFLHLNSVQYRVLLSQISELPKVCFNFYLEKRDIKYFSDSQ